MRCLLIAVVYTLHVSEAFQLPQMLQPSGSKRLTLRTGLASIQCSQSEMEWRKQQAEAALRASSKEAEDGTGEADYETRQTAGYVGSVYSDELISKQKKGAQPNLSTSVDDMNFFGAKGGGQLTRDGIANAQKTVSPRINAMDALQAICKEKNPKAEAIAQVIGDAYEAGVSVDAPQMKKAAALLAALEAATRSPAQEAAAAAAAAPGGIDAKLDVVFADEYAMPELDPDL